MMQRVSEPHHGAEPAICKACGEAMTVVGGSWARLVCAGCQSLDRPGGEWTLIPESDPVDAERRPLPRRTQGR